MKRQSKKGRPFDYNMIKPIGEPMTGCGHNPKYYCMQCVHQPIEGLAKAIESLQKQIDSLTEKKV